MKNHGITRSAVKPKPVEILKTKVFVAADTKPVTVNIEGQEIQEYEFNLTEYGKDEYISLISDRNAALDQNLTDTQMALCEVYEMMM